jgi:TatD DNase family protein
VIDTHCHLDLYRRPTDVADQANRAGVLTVAVTNLPSAFDRAQPHVRQFKNLRLALGLHPILAKQHSAERARFEELTESTSYIGEVGLDFSPEGPARVQWLD